MVLCTCGVKDDDGERMIACDICQTWMHTRCQVRVCGWAGRKRGQSGGWEGGVGRRETDPRCVAALGLRSVGGGTEGHWGLLVAGWHQPPMPRAGVVGCNCHRSMPTPAAVCPGAGHPRRGACSGGLPLLCMHQAQQEALKWSKAGRDGRGQRTRRGTTFRSALMLDPDGLALAL